MLYNSLKTTKSILSLLNPSGVLASVLINLGVSSRELHNNSNNILIIDQQRQAAKDQMRTLQEKQSLTLQHQQSQCQMLMKQLQSQMEAEMLMKSELVRNQMQMLAQNGGDLSGEF